MQSILLSHGGINTENTFLQITWQTFCRQKIIMSPIHMVSSLNQINEVIEKVKDAILTLVLPPIQGTDCTAQDSNQMFHLPNF